MEHNFWHNKWEKQEIGFHLNEVNPLLIQYFPALSLPAGARVFLPLCGKTKDIHWLLANGYQVAGVELSQIAIDQLFTELSINPQIIQLGNILHYSADHIDIFVGDIFELSPKVLQPVYTIYDRAALVALPIPMRQQYTQHLRHITQNAPQLLISLDYDQSLVDGPPFSVS
jgi:thiopurine S-methyltransferase